MSLRDDAFQVRSSSFPSLGEGTGQRATVNHVGFPVVTDFMTQLVLSGYAYHMQIGTEDAGVTSTTSIDDELVWMLADNEAGSAMIPLLYEVSPGVLAGATLVMAMLELDKDKVRYSSGGTAFVPANLRSDDPNSAGGSFYVGTDVAAAAKSAVPNSVELARKFYLEDTITDSLGYPGTWASVVYSINDRPPAVVLDAASVLCHFGAASADATGYGVLQFAQFPKTVIVG